MTRRLWNPAWLWMMLLLASALIPAPAFSETRGAESLLVDIEYWPDPVHVGDNADMTITLQNTGNDSLTVDLDIFVFDHVNPKQIVGRHTSVIIPACETFAISANWCPTRSATYDIGVDVFDNGTGDLMIERSMIVMVESDLSAWVSVSPATVHVNDNVTVSAKLCNTGHSMLYGIHYVIYAGLGNYIGSGDVAELWPAAECESVPGGGVELTAQWVPDAVGTYKVGVNASDANGTSPAVKTIDVAVAVATGSVPSGFSLALSPAAVTVEPGGSFDVAATATYARGNATVVPSKNTQIISPPYGSFVGGDVTVRAWVQTCNCTGGTELYVDGAFHSNGTRPPPTTVEHNGTYFELFDHYWDSSAASEGWHNLTVLGKHKEFCDTVFVCVNAICNLVVASCPANWTHDPPGINFTSMENVPVTAAFTFAVPADAQTGTYSIVLRVTGPLEMMLAEAVVTVAVVNGTAPPLVADLSVSMADIRLSPDSATEGTACTLLATIRNLGSAAGTGIVVVSDTNGTSIGSRDISLESGGILNLSFEWKPSAGNHTIKVTVVTISGGNRDLTNDLVTKVFTVRPAEAPQPPLPGLPRLRLALDRASVTMAPGGSVLVTATVSCEGAPVRGVHLAFTPSEGLRVDLALPEQPVDLRPGESWTAGLRLSAPQSLGNASRSGTLEVAVAGIGAAGETRELRVAIVEAPVAVGTHDLSVPLAAGALASGVVVIAVAAYGTEVGLVALLGLLLPLYSKIRKEEVLDQFTRGKIQGYITAYPGEHYSSIKAQLGLNNGALAYHLRVLEREGYVVSFRDGIYRRYYPKEAVLPRRRAQFSQMQEMIIEHIRAQPGITQDGLAQLLKVSNQVIYYHVRHLMTAGAIRLEKAGKETHCYVSGFEVS